MFFSSRDRLFVLPLFLVVFFFWRLGDDKLVGGKCVACYLMASVLAIYAFRHHTCSSFNFLMFVDDFFYMSRFVNWY